MEVAGRLPKVVAAKKLILVCGPYFRLRQDIWFVEVSSSLPKVATAKCKFSCLEHILSFDRISGFWRLLAAFQKLLQQKAKSLWKPISSVVRIYVYSGFETLSIQLFVYTYIRAFGTLSVQLFVCTYIRASEPYQFSCSYIRIFVCIFQHCGGHLRKDNCFSTIHDLTFFVYFMCIYIYTPELSSRSLL